MAGRKPRARGASTQAVAATPAGTPAPIEICSLAKMTPGEIATAALSWHELCVAARDVVNSGLGADACCTMHGNVCLRANECVRRLDATLHQTAADALHPHRRRRRRATPPDASRIVAFMLTEFANCVPSSPGADLMFTTLLFTSGARKLRDAITRSIDTGRIVNHQ